MIRNIPYAAMVDSMMEQVFEKVDRSDFDYDFETCVSDDLVVLSDEELKNYKFDQKAFALILEKEILDFTKSASFLRSIRSFTKSAALNLNSVVHDLKFEFLAERKFLTERNSKDQDRKDFVKSLNKEQKALFKKAYKGY